MINILHPTRNHATAIWSWFARLVITMLLLNGLFNVQAARAWFDGTFDSVYGSCPVTGNFVVTSQSYVGYFADPNEPYPKTGDIAYVHAVAANVSGCANDAIGFEFFLPEGAELAISQTEPVYCYRGRLSDNYYEPVPNVDGESACSQTPSIGTNGGLYFGWSMLPSNWWLEFQVPVRFNKQLLGLAGPNTHRLTAVTSTAFGNAFPHQAVTVFYEADFLNLQPSSLTTNSVRLNAQLYSYYKSGTAYFDYGTTTAYGQTVSVDSIAATHIGYDIFADLANLSPNSTYHWRARYVTADGTFVSPDQTFSTNTNPSVSYTLTASKTGTGSGTVTSSPAGIDCGNTCTANFTQGTSVTLTAAPASGSMFAGWSGACTGTGSCTVSMSSAKSVTASFSASVATLGTLEVSVDGLPSGASADITVTGPNGFSRVLSVLTGTTQRLSDVEAGSYSATAASVIVGSSTYNPTTVSQSITVPGGGTGAAAFSYTEAPATTNVTLSVSKNGTGGGTVTSSPGGIDCGATCSASFAQGTSIVLSVASEAGSTFGGWGGACTGTGVCQVTMDAAKSVTAAFNTDSQGTTVSVSKGSQSPSNGTAHKGDTDVPMLQFMLSPGGEALTVQGFSLQASGTGQDATDITSVKVYLDANGNGQADGGEAVVASGTYAANDGVLTLAPTTPLSLNADSTFLITYDFSTSLAALSPVPARRSLAESWPGQGTGWGMTLGVLVLTMGVFAQPFVRRRWVAGAVLSMALVLVGCGGSTVPKPPQSVTYSVSLTAVQAQGQTTNTDVIVSGLPIAGATLTLQK